MNERIYIYDEKDQMLSERRVENLSLPVPSAIGYLQNDLQGTDSVGLFPLSDQMVTLDYNAGSIGLALNSIVEVTQITLTPGSPIHRVDAESLKVFISDDDTSYTEYEGWFLRKDPESGALELVFPEPVLTQYLKIHCTFDERHPDLSAVALDESSCKASFQAPAAQMVQVYTMESVEAEDLMEYDGVGNRISEAEIRDNLRADYASSFYSETLFLRTNGSSGANGRYGYEYDERGNLIGKGEFYLEGSDPQGPVSVDMSQGERWSYEWDNLNRLVRVEHNGALSASYTYSPRGLRVKKSASSILYFVYDLSGQLIYESDGSSYTSYVHAFGKHLARFDGSVDASGNHTPTDTYFYHTDHVGTVNGVSDMSGTVVWEASYTAFGEVINITGLLEQRAIFGGKGYDSDSALYYFNARWYDPENGRFISEDPARDGVNWYAYTYNNPLKWTDPTGMYGFNGGYSGYNYSTGESVDNGWNSTTGSYDDDDDDDDDESSVGTPGGGTAQPPVQPPSDPMDNDIRQGLNEEYQRILKKFQEAAATRDNVAWSAYYPVIGGDGLNYRLRSKGYSGGVTGSVDVISRTMLFDENYELFNGDAYFSPHPVEIVSGELTVFSKNDQGDIVVESISTTDSEIMDVSEQGLNGKSGFIHGGGNATATLYPENPESILGYMAILNLKVGNEEFTHNVVRKF